MSETPFAEATVVITPKLTGFVKDLETQLADKMSKVKPPVIRIPPGLTLDFVGDLRNQVNKAIEQAQKKVKPFRIKAVIEPVGVARGTAGILAGGGAGGGGGGGGGAGGAVGTAGRTSAANNALARSMEHVVTARLALTKAYDESIPIEKQADAVKKVTTALDEAQAAAERTLTKAIVAKDKELQKSAGRQLKEIADFQASFAPRVAQVEAQVPAAGTASAIANTRKAADATKAVVAGLNAADLASKKLSKSSADLIGWQDLQKKSTALLAEATRAETKALAQDNVVVQKAAISAKARAVALDQLTRQQIEAIQQVQRAESEAAKQADRLARSTAAARARQQRAAAASASAERRRSEQLTRGGQASLLSLAGIRGATLAASRSFLVGAAAITVFSRAVKQFADLERNLHVFSATTSATAEQMEAVRKEATALGADLTLPAVSAGDAAGAMVELAKAGLSVQDAIDGARAVLELSTAAAIDNADAVRLVANVLNAFSLTGRDAAEVADTLANAANAAQGSIADIGTAFQQAATAGHQVGLSFQDTATFLTILAKNGIRGSDAGTSLRTALIRLVNPSKKAKEQFEELGITLRDAQGNLRPDVFLQIADAARRLGPAQRDATIALIGGQDAFRAVTILGRQSVDSFLAMRKALREEGTAAELAKARTEGLHGAMDGLQSVLETVGTNLAGNVGPGLSNFVRNISSGITALSENAGVTGLLAQSLEALSIELNRVGNALQGVATVAFPLANALTATIGAIGVHTILLGVVAFRSLNAVMDGAILRLRVLKPLFATIATAKIGASLSTGFTTASIALERFNKQAGAVDGAPIKGFQRLTQVQKELAVATAASATRMSSFRVALKSIGPTLIGLSTSTTAIVIAASAAAAAIFFLVTRETAAERATRKLREETEKLASSLDRVKQATISREAADRAAQRGVLGVQQATLNLRIAQQALAASDAGPASAERKQLLLSVRVAQQDLTFAIQDQKKALEELIEAQEAERAAQRNSTKERRDAKRIFLDQIAASKEAARISFVRRFQLGLEIIPKETLARRDLIKTLREQAATEALSEQPAERAIALRKQLIALVAEKSVIPIDQLAPDLAKIFDEANLSQALSRAAKIFGIKGKEAVAAFVASVTSAVQGGASLAKAIKLALEAAGDGASSTAIEVGSTTADFFEHGFAGRFANVVGPNITNTIVTSLTGATKLALAELKGASNQALLDIARDTLRIATSVRRRAERGFAENPNAKRQATLDRAISAEQAAKADVERITGDIDQATDDAAKAIEDAQKARDTKGQKVIDSILKGRRATLLQRKITTAGLSDWLGDDLKTNEAWLQFLKDQKVALLKRLRAIGASKEVIETFMQTISDMIFTTKNTIAKINDDIADNVADLKNVVFTKIDLRIRIAQARDDVAAEIKLRTQKVNLLTKEIKKLERAGKKNTVAWLELVAQREEEKAAIADLRKAEKERNDAFKNFTFEFLQRQQGFATNLLGNLIPGGATAGLVGAMSFGPSISGTPGLGGTGGLNIGGGAAIGSGPIGTRGAFPEGRPVVGGGPQGADVATGVKADSATAAAGMAGPTRGQATTQTDLLRQILNQLRVLNGQSRNPHAKQQRAIDTAPLSGYEHGQGHGG